ncbi:MAG: hypothetical protein O2810_02385 [Bacteroidetes bacterium]|nr:hypothetical protein [Bacteroidota bacterium]MDA1084365.1 hypothetical protein [Bacteroidota bacterium]
MLKNVSYNDKKLHIEIDALLGKPFTFLERLKLGGVGSPKLHVTACSKEIDALFLLDHNVNTCNVELRPKGIILRFRSLLETYALIVPYYKLTLFKGTSDAYSVHTDHHKVSVSAQSEPVRLFFKKIQQQKAKNTEDYL